MPFIELGLEPPMTSTGIHLGTGDFSRMDHDTVIEVINRQALTTHQARVSPECQPMVARELNALNAALNGFRDYVGDPTHYPEGAEATITRRFEDADSQTQDTDMLRRISERVRQFPQPAITVTDLDGTLTQLTDMHDHLMNRLPGSSIAEPILAENGREAFPWVFVTTWQPLLEASPPIFKAAAQGVQIRPGVGRFFNETRGAGIDTFVLSANFKPFVDGVMEQIPEAHGTEVLAVTPTDLRATQKAVVLEHVAKTNPDRPIIYLGDGSSDISAITPTVAGYFALEGSQFSRELTERGVPHLTYRDFHDVTDAYRRINPGMSPSTAK